jgi:hypothetical protein
VLNSWELACVLALEIETALRDGTFNLENFNRPDGQYLELKQCWDHYCDTHENPTTIRILNTVRKRIFANFPPDKKIISLSQVELNLFWEHLIVTQKLSVARMIHVI